MSTIDYPTPLHKSRFHESGFRHASGEARYVDDLPEPPGMLLGWVVESPVAHGTLTRLDVSAARALPGVTVLTAADIPGHNDVSPTPAFNEELLAVHKVYTVGQPVAVIYAESYARCREAAALVELEIEALPAILDVRSAVEAKSFIGPPHIIRRGDVDAALAGAAFTISGELESGWQDHFYLETQSALSLPMENGAFKVFSSTQHPSEVQAKVAEVLGKRRYDVVVESPRMGGGFGGKETQGNHYACFAALGTHYTGRPVKLWLNRDQDMTQTGKRHPWYSRYEAGFDATGRITALRCFGYPNGGWTADLSLAIRDRYLFHLDNAYFLPNCHLESRVARTNMVNNTAFRGFGGPQGVVVIEEILNRAAERLGLDPAEIRRRNFYGDAPRNTAPYGQEITENRLERIYSQLMETSEYRERRAAIEAFNAKHRWVKRGIGFQPVKFGISFTATFLNQAGALVLVYADGTVQLNHGGTEMGQGLHTKMLAVCAHELGVPIEDIRAMNTATDKVPNTSATAASSGSDLNGMAVRNACIEIRERLRPVAAALFGIDEARASEIAFADGQVYIPGTELEVGFADVVSEAYMKQIGLSATGYYRTPGIGYDIDKGRGRPFYYFAYGGAISEIEVNGLTGEFRLLRTDILHDVGDSLIPSIDRGQVEGAFIQGLGWLTCEELLFNDKGVLRTHSPDTYKIPAVGEAPLDFRVELLERAPQPGTIHGSKAVGEPPFMLAISAVTALRQAVGAFSAKRVPFDLKLPATGEAVLRAIEEVRAVSAEAGTQETPAPQPQA